MSMYAHLTAPSSCRGYVHVQKSVTAAATVALAVP